MTMTTADPLPSRAELGKPKRSPFTTTSAADLVFRQALARGDYPVVPEALAAAVDAQDRLRQLEQAVRSTRTMQMIVSDTVADLLAGRPVDPAAFDADLLQAHLQGQVSRMTVSTEMLRQIEQGWRTLVGQSLPSLLDGLRDQLDELLIEVRTTTAALGDLPVDDPAAIAAGTSAQRTALLDLGPLSVRYERLRLAQQAALAAASDRFPGARGDGRQPGDPTWQDVFDRGTYEFSDVPMKGTLPLAPAGPARLCRLARREDVWLPTREQLDEAHAELSLGLAELRARRAGRA